MARRTSDDLQQSIERGRARVVTDVEALQIAVRDKLDWRRRVREHPGMAIGLVFCVGLWIGVR
jgi:hypothetical protein